MPNAAKSSQVANFQIQQYKQVRCIMQRAQNNKRKELPHGMQRTRLSCGYKIPWTPPAYGAGWANFPWAPGFTRYSRPGVLFRYLLYYHVAMWHR